MRLFKIINNSDVNWKQKKKKIDIPYSSKISITNILEKKENVFIASYIESNHIRIEAAAKEKSKLLSWTQSILIQKFTKIISSNTVFVVDNYHSIFCKYTISFNVTFHMYNQKSKLFIAYLQPIFTLNNSLTLTSSGTI